MLPQIRYPITHRVESSINSMEIAMLKMKLSGKAFMYSMNMCRTKNEAFRNFRIKWIFLQIITVQDHLKTSITDKDEITFNALPKIQ